MKYAELAEHTRPYKEDAKGGSSMCRIMQELIDEELKESHLEIAETLLRKNVMSKEEIAEMCSLTLAEVEQLAASLGR